MRKAMMITGAVRNTGYAAAQRFAREGWDVCITSRDKESAVVAAERLHREFPEIRTLGVGMDQSAIHQIIEAFAAVKAAFGRLDAFIANAAHLGIGYDTLTTTPEQWDDVINTNLRGTFFCCQEAAKLMAESGGGTIALVSSVHAHQAIPGRIAYAASKAGINAMTRCMAVELGHLNIRVNTVIAGSIWTERWLGQTAEEVQARRDRYPVGKESAPEDIASALYFLCSDQSPTVTGTEMTVDSGVSICLLPYNKHWNDKQGESV